VDRAGDRDGLGARSGGGVLGSLGARSVDGVLWDLGRRSVDRVLGSLRAWGVDWVLRSLGAWGVNGVCRDLGARGIDWVVRRAGLLLRAGSGSWVLLVLAGGSVDGVHWLRSGSGVLHLAGWRVNRVGGHLAGLLVAWVVRSLSDVSLMIACSLDVRDIQEQGSR
jgi:hypothetical protein